MGIYFLIGLVYAVINGWIRGLNDDGDWLLTIVWITLWPLCFIALIFTIQEELIFRRKLKK